ncbi:hypothetical protein DPMN_097842 [Dreissena polymorpha]|uniref:Uncharacterized protein n=1 Tax=Dreissena polymorpha TaxID=45954 RepID=A0A9D4LAZ3_DREPO|nr:hypothetical protein DPMN_097842 [Dreissena polymorpha]
MDSSICRIVSEFKETTMSIKQSKRVYPFTSGKEFWQENYNDADISGITVETNRPSLIFCGNNDKFSHFSQLIPIHSMATQFYFPSMPLLASFYNAKLVLLTNSDNTIVNISKGFDAFHLLYNRGNKAVQDIDLSVSYNIIASEPIAVGVQFSDHLNRTVFHIVPPTHNFVSGFFASLFRDPDLKMPQPPTVVHSAYHNGSSDTSYTDNTNDKPFYRFWDSKGPAYGFSVVQFNHNTSMIVPGYSAIGPIITPVSHRH